MQAKARFAIQLPSLAIEVFKMQFDYSRVVEIGRKVVRGAGSLAAHVNHGISYFRVEGDRYAPDSRGRRAKSRRAQGRQTEHTAQVTKER